jgi:hypothetical protein
MGMLPTFAVRLPTASPSRMPTLSTTRSAALPTPTSGPRRAAAWPSMGSTPTSTMRSPYWIAVDDVIGRPWPVRSTLWMNTPRAPCSRAICPSLPIVTPLTPFWLTTISRSLSCSKSARSSGSKTSGPISSIPLSRLRRTPNHRDHIANRQHRVSVRYRALLTVPEADHRIAAAHALLDLAHGPARPVTDLERASNQPRQCRLAGSLVVASAGVELARQFAGGLAQVDAQQRRCDLAGEEDDADKPHEVGQRVRGGDVRLHALDLGGGKAQVPERFGRRANYSRFGGRAGGKPGRGASIEGEQRHRGQHHRQHQQRLDERQHHVAQAGAVQVGKELGAARIAHREDEQRECDLLQVALHLAARLPEQQCHEEGAAHAAELDRPHAQLADQEPEANGDEQDGDRYIAEEANGAAHTGLESR